MSEAQLAETRERLENFEREGTGENCRAQACAALVLDARLERIEKLLERLLAQGGSR